MRVVNHRLYRSIIPVEARRRGASTSRPSGTIHQYVPQMPNGSFCGSIALPHFCTPIMHHGEKSLLSGDPPLHASLSRTVAGYVGIRHSWRVPRQANLAIRRQDNNATTATGDQFG